jgi:hypothetical protein
VTTSKGPDVFWGHVNDALRSFGRAWREARQNHPNYPTSQESANALSNEFEQSATDYLGVLNQRTPPAGLATQFGALKITLRALLDDLRASPVNGEAVDAAYNDYVTACQTVQQFADSTNAGVDLECAGPSGPLSDADFFSAIAPAIATMHMQTDDVQSALGARTDATSLNTLPQRPHRRLRKRRQQGHRSHSTDVRGGGAASVLRRCECNRTGRREPPEVDDGADGCDQHISNDDPPPSRRRERLHPAPVRSGLRRCHHRPRLPLIPELDPRPITPRPRSRDDSPHVTNTG